MLAIFVDTAYVSARVNTRDQWHASAVAWEASLSRTRLPLVTTEFVLIEVADSLAGVRLRFAAAHMIATMRSSPWVHVIPASSELFAAAFVLYRDRPDKDWGLTDCSSFVVMRERGLAEALTTDTHFRQAGFRPLLLELPPT